MVSYIEHRLAGNMLCPVRAVECGFQRYLAAVHRAQHGNRAMAISAQRSQQGPLCHDAGMAGGMVNFCQNLPHGVIRRAAFNPDRTLCRCWQPFIHRKRRARAGAAQTFQPGSSQQGDIRFARCQFCQTRCDIAAKHDDFAIWPAIEHLCRPARGAGADTRALRNAGDAGCTDQHIAHVRTRQNGGDGQRSGTDCFHIFHGMDRCINMALRQPRIQFLGPQGLAAKVSQRLVQNPVPAGAHWHQFHRAFIPPMGSTQAGARFMGLRHGKRRLASPDTDGGGWFGVSGHRAYLP